MSKQITINKLPEPTWNFLKVNQVVLNIDDSYNQTYVEHTAKSGEKNIYLQIIDNNNNAISSTKLLAEDNAEIELVQVIKPSKGYNVINSIQAKAQKNSVVKVIQFMLGCGDNYSENVIELEGEKSSCLIDIAYLTEKQNLDINILVNHKGVKTNSDILVEGIIGEEGKKIFRGTINLQNGASEAEGKEQENVLLLDDNIKNQTIPVILCGQEDVKGAHGSSIGELNEEIIFYLKSRGIDKSSAEKLMSYAKFNSVLEKIDDKEISETVEKFIKERIKI